MSAIAARALAWFDRHGRHDLPWQHPRDAYRVWISETMLQQTQVVTAIPYFQRFLAALPDVPTLAAAPLDRVLALWSGLGYYARARNLHATAQACMRDHDGALPSDFTALLALPGIGRSTAGAILALAHGMAYPILDGNVRRLLCRHRGVRGWPGSAATQKVLWKIAVDELPTARIADYTQALMDLGAGVCTPRTPNCTACPLRADCVALREHIVTQLPERRPAKPVPTRDTVVVIACDGSGRVLLQRRPPTGVWAGLWSLPEAPDPATAQAWVARHLRVDVTVMELPAFVHKFSHFRLHVHPLLWRDARARDAVRDNDDLRWQAIDALAELGLPAPIRSLLQGLT